MLKKGKMNMERTEESTKKSTNSVIQKNRKKKCIENQKREVTKYWHLILIPTNVYYINLYTQKIKPLPAVTPIDTSEVPEEINHEIKLTLQNVKREKAPDEDGILTDFTRDVAEFHKRFAQLLTSA